MSLPKINLSINPSYHCNFRCPWCYLTPEQLGDKKTIDDDRLNKLLAEVATHREINHIDLYGGEIGILKKEQLKNITDVIRFYYKDRININTNLSVLREEFFNPDYYLSVSYDLETRQDHRKVRDNMAKLPVDFSILCLATKEVMKASVEHWWQMFNDVDRVSKEQNVESHLKSVELKPYSANQANDQKITHTQFENYVLDLLRLEKSSKKGNYNFVNRDKIITSLAGKYNAYSDDHLYITPNGKFAVLEFDKDNKEYFLELNSFKEYEDWCIKEKEKTISDICRKCNYLGGCLTEHYQYVDSLKDGCNGYRYLLDTYQFRYGE
jgi:sulfatase maturation enzyme AslB (radical SAM superfamily)